jgi:multiple sugar transport system permease protein
MGGGLNLTLGKLGIPPIFWLGPNWAMTSIIFLNIWKGFPFFMISILAGLQVIPKSLYEVAQIDGASAAQQFLYITLPSLRDVLLIASLLSAGAIIAILPPAIVYLLLQRFVVGGLMSGSVKG